MLRDKPSAPDAAALALEALVWTLSDHDRAERLLSLTGLTPHDLRTRVDEPAVLGAVLGFLEAYEDDLVACARALGVAPPVLVQARAELER